MHRMRNLWVCRSSVKFSPVKSLDTWQPPSKYVFKCIKTSILHSNLCLLYYITLQHVKKSKHSIERVVENVLDFLRRHLELDHRKILLFSHPSPYPAITFCVAVLIRNYVQSPSEDEILHAPSSTSASSSSVEHYSVLKTRRENVDKTTVQHFIAFVAHATGRQEFLQYPLHLPRSYLKILNRIFLTPSHLKPKWIARKARAWEQTIQ
jgi:hypothetical protein